MQQKFEIYVSFESLNALFRNNIFLYPEVLFLEFMDIHDFFLGTLLEKSSCRIKLKLLLQLKKALTKKMVEVKFENNGL